MDERVEELKDPDPVNAGRGVPLKQSSEEEKKDSSQSSERLDERIRKAGI